MPNDKPPINSPATPPASDEKEPQADPLATSYDYEDEKPKTAVPVPEIKPEASEIPTPPEKTVSKIKTPPIQETVGPIQPKPVGSKAIIKRGMPKTTKVIMWALVALIVAAGAFYLFFYRATLVINPSPQADKIILDDREIEPGTYRINPGRHTVQIKKKGYISYVVDKNFKMAQRVNLAFQFKKQPEGQKIAEGGSNMSLTSDKTFIIFQGKDDKLYSAKRSGEPSLQAISTNAYPNIREILISENNLFALILDKDTLRIADLLRQDLLSQSELKLPPMAQAISSVTWNSVTDSSYFTEVNAHITYDLKTDYGWDLILANRQHSQSEILMQIDESKFRNIKLDWTSNAKQVLIAGGELGIIDLPSRSYSEVLKDKNISSAKWSPTGSKFAAMSSDGQVYVSEGTSAKTIAVKGKLYRWANDNELAIVGDGRATLYHFDTEELINYAEIKGLENCQSFEVVDGQIYFADNEGIKSAPLQLPDY